MANSFYLHEWIGAFGEAQGDSQPSALCAPHPLNPHPSHGVKTPLWDRQRAVCLHQTLNSDLGFSASGNWDVEFCCLSVLHPRCIDLAVQMDSVSLRASPSSLGCSLPLLPGQGQVSRGHCQSSVPSGQPCWLIRPWVFKSCLDQALPSFQNLWIVNSAS